MIPWYRESFQLIFSRLLTTFARSFLPAMDNYSYISHIRPFFFKVMFPVLFCGYTEIYTGDIAVNVDFSLE